MKKKILSILILIVLLLNSSLLMVISEAVSTISEEMNVKEGTDVAETLIEMQPNKYINYDTTTPDSDTGSKGALIQINVKTGILYHEYYLYGPITKSTTTVQAPELAGMKPERAEVIVKSTKATNGGSSASYEYDADTGVLKITAENNPGENGEIYSENVENARDEYEIIFIYNSDVYTANEDEREIDVKVSCEQEVKHNNVSKVSAEKTSSYLLTNNLGDIVSIEQETSDIYNGYITANTLNPENKYETDYTETVKATISNKDVANY